MIKWVSEADLPEYLASGWVVTFSFQVRSKASPDWEKTYRIRFEGDYGGITWDSVSVTEVSSGEDMIKMDRDKLAEMIAKWEGG